MFPAHRIPKVSLSLLLLYTIFIIDYIYSIQMFPVHRIPKVSLSLLLLYMIIYIVSKCFQHIEFQKFLSVYY